MSQSWTITFKLKKTSTFGGNQQILRRVETCALFLQEYLLLHRQCPTDKRNSYRLRNLMWRIWVLHFLSCRVVQSYQLPSIFLKKWTVQTVGGKRSEMYKWWNTQEVKCTRSWMYISRCYKKRALQVLQHAVYKMWSLKVLDSEQMVSERSEL
jgi:hypothetical protein